MKHSWTGGQYSVWRALVGLALLGILVRILLVPTDSQALTPFHDALRSLSGGFVGPRGALKIETAAFVAMGAAAFALALGFRDRIAALLLAVAWIVVMPGRIPARSPDLWAVALLLVLHGCTHGSPYGSFDARGRGDPGGSWILPDWNHAGRWMLLAAVIAVDQASLGGRLVSTLMGEPAAATRSLALAWRMLPAILLPLVLQTRARPWWWSAAIALELWEGSHLEPAPWKLSLVLLHFSTLDPGWLPPARADGPALVFFDGHCGLCHRLVRFALAEDRSGRALRFSPLQGETLRAACTETERASLPDSVAVRTAEGRVLTRSGATIQILALLGGLWRATAIALHLVPRAARDLAYDAVARVRVRLFAAPSSACPVLPAHLRRRFDD